MKREGRQGWKGGGGGGNGGMLAVVCLSCCHPSLLIVLLSLWRRACQPPDPRGPALVVLRRGLSASGPGPASCVSCGGLPYCSGCCGPLLFRAGLSPYSPSPVQANWGLTSRGRPYSHSGRSYSVRAVLQMSTSLTALVLVLRLHCFQW